MGKRFFSVPQRKISPSALAIVKYIELQSRPHANET